jgi:N-acetylglucosamine kinase-like BadF-type ATPase
VEISVELLGERVLFGGEAVDLGRGVSGRLREQILAACLYEYAANSPTLSGSVSSNLHRLGAAAGLPTHQLEEIPAIAEALVVLLGPEAGDVVFGPSDASLVLSMDIASQCDLLVTGVGALSLSVLAPSLDPTALERLIEAAVAMQSVAAHRAVLRGDLDAADGAIRAALGLSSGHPVQRFLGSQAELTFGLVSEHLHLANLNETVSDERFEWFRVANRDLTTACADLVDHLQAQAERFGTRRVTLWFSSYVYTDREITEVLHTFRSTMARRPFSLTLYLCNDTVSILLGDLDGNGTVAMAGNGGSVAARMATESVVDAPSYQRIGGQDELFGSQGSGYAVAVNTLKSVWRLAELLDAERLTTQLDTLRSRTVDFANSEWIQLVDAINSHFSLSPSATADELLTLKRRLAIAPLASRIRELADAGNALASYFVVREASELAADVCMLLAQPGGFVAQAPLVVGQMFQSRVYSDAFWATVVDAYPSVASSPDYRNLGNIDRRGATEAALATRFGFAGSIPKALRQLVRVDHFNVLFPELR